jgi:hypothetical protein
MGKSTKILVGKLHPILGGILGTTQKWEFALYQLFNLGKLA